MNNDGPIGFLFGLLLSSILWGIVAASLADRTDFEREAVQHGAATWTVDEDGNRVFQWREAK